MNEKIFYMVYVEGRNAPAKIHNYPEAQEEAKRLACLNENRGKKVFILQAIDWCVAPCPEVEWHRLEEHS